MNKPLENVTPFPGKGGAPFAAQDGRIIDLMHRDPGNRGFISSLPPEPLDAVVRELLRAKRALIVTGFPILRCGGIGETDGPPGAANIGHALQALGCEVMFAVGVESYDAMRALTAHRCPGARVRVFNTGWREDAAYFLLESFQPTHVISIERPGAACDGHYYSMRGDVLDPFVAPIEPLVRDAKCTTIAIGDGGNELGTADFRPYVEKHVANGAQVCATTRADYTLGAGVSNWWSWGLAAALSLRCRKFLLPRPAVERTLVDLCNKAGLVDGVRHERCRSVDGIDMPYHYELLCALAKILNEEGLFDDKPDFPIPVD